MMTTRIMLMLAFAALLLGGCGNDKISCNIQVVPKVQEADKGEVAINVNVQGYLFYRSTADYHVATYADAAAGIATNNVTGSTVNFNKRGVSKADFNLSFNPVTEHQVMIVVYDDVTGMFAYGSFWIEPGLDDLKITQYFKPWKAMYTYTERPWTIINEAYPPEPDPVAGSKK